MHFLAFVFSVFRHTLMYIEALQCRHSVLFPLSGSTMDLKNCKSPNSNCSSHSHLESSHFHRECPLSKHSNDSLSAKVTDEQYTTINQSTAGCFDPRVCKQRVACKQLTKTLRSKRPAVDWLIIVYCSSVNFATINATMSLYSITIHYHSNIKIFIIYMLFSIISICMYSSEPTFYFYEKTHTEKCWVNIGCLLVAVCSMWIIWTPPL